MAPFQGLAAASLEQPLQASQLRRNESRSKAADSIHLYGEANPNE